MLVRCISTGESSIETVSNVKILKIWWDDLEDIVTYRASGDTLSTIPLKQVEKLTIYK